MTIKQLITDHGGVAKFRRKLAGVGVNIPLTTAEGWMYEGKSPQTSFLQAMGVILKANDRRVK